MKTERSGCLMLFGLPFFLVGIGFLFWSVIPTVYDSWRVQSWPAVSGQLIQADLTTNHSSDSTTHEARARYRYHISGREYIHDRVAINEGGDNIGDFQQQLGRKLENLYHSHQPVTVFYNPTDPQDAVINRDIRWGLLGFKMIFVLVFGGVGAGLVFWGARGKKTIEVADVASTPWLTRPEWHSGVIRSDARSGMIGIWIFTVIWNLISAPVAFQFIDIWKEEGAVALLALLFPGIGMGLVFWAIKLTREWQRFGITPLQMDPFPGSIGGDVGGEINVGIPYQSGMVCKLTLSNIYSYVTGSGKNRSRSERVEWQDDGYAKIIPRQGGIGLQFRFEVPDGLNESQEHSTRYYFWRLHVELEMPGTDLDRSFEIPVYKTGKLASRIRVNSSKDQPAGVAPLKATDLLPLTTRGNSTVLSYPMLRKPGHSLGLLVFGSIFAGVGVFLWSQAAREGMMLYFMSLVFGLVGGAIVLGAIWSAFNALSVTLDGRTVTSIRTLFGIPVSNYRYEYSDVISIEADEGMKSRSGNKHKIEYSVIARVPGGKITLAEHLDSASKKNLAVDYFAEEVLGSGSRFVID